MFVNFNCDLTGFQLISKFWRAILERASENQFSLKIINNARTETGEKNARRWYIFWGAKGGKNLAIAGTNRCARSPMSGPCTFGQESGSLLLLLVRSYLPFRRVRLRPYSHRQDVAPWKCSQPADQPASCLSSIESLAYIRHDCYDWRSSKIRIYILYFRRNVCVVEIKSRFVKINSFSLAAEGESVVNCHDMLLCFMIFSRMIVDDISFSLDKLIPCP